MKHFLFFVSAACLLMFASCDFKTCVCYQQVNGRMTMTDETYDAGTRCNAASRGNKICVEEAERVDPSKMALDAKKK